MIGRSPQFTYQFLWKLAGRFRRFLKVFTIYGHGCHLGHVTIIMFSNFHFLIPERFHTKLKQCFLRKNMSPQPSSFVGYMYIENYGIKLWRPFKQQYSMGRNGHRPKWLWAEMVMDRNGYGPK